MRSCDDLDRAAARHAHRVAPAAWSTVRLHPVLHQKRAPRVLDLSRERFPVGEWTVGRYDEHRPGLYDQALFAGERTWHMGVDLGAPVGTAVHAFCAGEVVHSGYNPADGDYGHVLVTEHRVLEEPFFALWGHLSAASVRRSWSGKRFVAGAVLGWLGPPEDNGGWAPHLHLQLSWDRPETHDLPGVVQPAERERALSAYPDPRLVLGPLY